MNWTSNFIFKVDQEILLNAGNSIQRLKMYPYFDVAHYILTISSLREDLGPGYTTFSRRHPLSCWLSSMLVCFAGSFLANFLLGEPIVAVLKKQEDIILASIVWYMIFYSPFDIAFTFSHILPVKTILSILKECQRAYKIHHGVSYAARLYPNSHFIHVLVGTAKGAGTGIVRSFGQLVIKGLWIPTQSELLRPSFTSKSCVFCSILLTVHKSGFVYLPHEIIYLGIVLFFVYFKLSAILLNVTEPLAPIENIFCAIFMGGIWDALSRALATSNDRRTVDGKADNNPLTSEHKKAQ